MSSVEVEHEVLLETVLSVIDRVRDLDSLMVGLVSEVVFVLSGEVLSLIISIIKVGFGLVSLLGTELDVVKTTVVFIIEVIVGNGGESRLIKFTPVGMMGVEEVSITEDVVVSKQIVLSLMSNFVTIPLSVRERNEVVMLTDVVAPGAVRSVVLNDNEVLGIGDLAEQVDEDISGLLASLQESTLAELLREVRES